MTIVLDAGALIAIERADRDVMALLKAERQAGHEPRTHGGVVAQVWRGGSGRQAVLARLLVGAEVIPLDDRLGRASGALLGSTATGDVVDAAVIAMTNDGDVVLTSDPQDLVELARASGRYLEIVPV